MAYQVLARKWRPQDFDSVVGQGAVVQALRNGLTDGRIAQAYLFSGIRGVGKTSVARVLAKALNCRNGSPSDPCNECETCRDITNGSDLDVLEIDAATYSKVEQVRDLTDSLQYGPARDPYKVVIIDEIHRLSRQAFDALLKIVEEPPPHLVFIFATTESEAVPATVLSRCQSFQFGRVPLAEMVEHLNRVATAEELEVGDHALHLIARASEGSVRDAIALLDQLATFGGGKIADDEVGRILGAVDLALFLDLLRAIAAGNSEAVSGFVEHIEQAGWDPRNVYGDFLAYCRDALHLALDPDNARVDLPVEEASALAEQAADTGYENLLRLLHLLLESEMTVRRSEAASLAFEIALLRAAELPKLTAVEAMLSPSGGSEATARGEGDKSSPPRSGSTSSSRSAAREAAAARQAPESPPAEPQTVEQVSSGPRAVEPPIAESRAAQPPASETRASEPRAAEPPASEAAPEPSTVDPPTPEPPDFGPEPPFFEPPASGNGAPAVEMAEPAEGANGDAPVAPPLDPPEIGEGRQEVEKLLERISYKKQPLAAHLSGAQSLEVIDSVLIIYTHPSDTVLEKTIRRESNRQVLEETLVELLGPSGNWKLRTGKQRDTSTNSAAESNEPPAEELTDDPRVQTVLDLFGGHVESVQKRDESPEEQGA